VSQPLEQDAGFERLSFAKSCAYCGARFEVLVSRQRGNNQEEDYACPECNKGYTVRAAMPPLVNLLTRRLDGKSDSYQETMF
jgi:hypothetical protein